MTTREQFETLFDTLELDDTVAPEETIRQAPGEAPTLAFTALPSIDLDASTSPELELGETIGEGGMGIVRLARQRALVRDVAVKTLRDDHRTPEARAGLLHEALVTGGLEHPNVVPVYTIGETADGAPIIVMKRIEGTPWSAVIDRGETPPGFDEQDPLGWHLDIFGQVCLAAHFAHSHAIIHRDIKPENVMIGEYGEVYLLDWGIAVTTDRERATYLPHAANSQGICGTPNYMPPEMTHGDGNLVSPRTDVYLLGATLYHALTGDPPHQGSSLFEILYRAHESPPPPLEELPEELRGIVRKAMAKAPDDRFSSVDELRTAIADFQRHRSSIALADEAKTSLERLRTLVSSDSEENEPAIRNAFGECRFGFHQALRVWPENPDALAGLREALLAMTRFELSVENPGAARALLTELEGDFPELEHRIDELDEELAQRRREFQKLKKLEKESDLSEGAQMRAVAAIFTAIVWSAIPLAAEWAWHAGWYEMTSLNYLLHGFVFSGFVLGVVFLIRRSAFRNRANRALMRLVFGVCVIIPIFRGVAHLAGLWPLTAISLESMIYAMAFVALGIMSNRLAWFGGGAFVLAGLVGIMWPDLLFKMFAVANFAALAWLYYIWRPDEEDSDATPIAGEA